MLAIDFPSSELSIRKEEGKEQIWDAIRKKWVRLTPEEWVRQNFIQYLLLIKQYPAALLSVEKEIWLGERKKRYDVVVYKHAQPWMIIECKQPDVLLTETTMMQVMQYNMHSCCTYVVITNGNHSKAWLLENGIAKEITELPHWL